MRYTVTIDTLPQFLSSFSNQLSPEKKFYIEVLDEKELYINSEEYISGKTNEIVSSDEFIHELELS